MEPPTASVAQARVVLPLLWSSRRRVQWSAHTYPTLAEDPKYHLPLSTAHSRSAMQLHASTQRNAGCRALGRAMSSASTALGLWGRRGRV